MPPGHYRWVPKVIYNTATSFTGYIADEANSLAWLGRARDPRAQAGPGRDPRAGACRAALNPATAHLARGPHRSVDIDVDQR